MLRIVAARDGGLCRIKLPGGVLTAAQARAVAHASRAFGNGAVEFTNRANLQLRGIAPQRQAGLIDHVLAAGLGPASAGADDVRNLMLSPMAGLDPHAIFDTRPLARDLLQRLEHDRRYHQLSPKFAIQLDGGEALAERHHHHDLWLSPLCLQGELHLALGVASELAGATPVAAVPAQDGLALLLAVLDRFLALAGPTPGRLREWLEGRSTAALLDGLGLGIKHGPFAAMPSPAVPAALGIHPQGTGGQVAVGLAPVLGRLSADTLDGLASLACEFGDGQLRLTPWQGLLLAGVARGAVPIVQAKARASGLLVDRTEPLAALVACTGSAGCARGLADTKADARQLARLLGRAMPVHLSGCARSCAQASVAPATLLAVGPGRYDLFFRDPAVPGLGLSQGRGLTLQEAATLLAARSRSALDD